MIINSYFKVFWNTTLVNISECPCTSKAYDFTFTKKKNFKELSEFVELLSGAC